MKSPTNEIQELHAKEWGLGNPSENVQAPESSNSLFA